MFLPRFTSGHQAQPYLRVRKVFNQNHQLQSNRLMTINYLQQTLVFLDCTFHCILLALFLKVSFFWLSRLKHLVSCRRTSKDALDLPCNCEGLRDVQAEISAADPSVLGRFSGKGEAFVKMRLILV